MTRKLLLTIAVLAAIGGSVGHTANAGMVNPLHKPVAKMTLQEQVKYYNANILHAQNTLHWFHSQAGSWALDGKRYPAAYSVAQRQILFHVRLLKAATRKLNEVKAKLQPKLPAHYAGWMCIHGDQHYRHAPGGEGAWYATNPNGHYNGLQMTINWMGVISGNPNNYTPIQILWAAETGYKNSGYSSQWLQGQWGQTISPCWQYFGR